MATLHYTSGNNIDAAGDYTPAQAGFNLADVTYVDQLNQLPDGVMGLVWLNQYNGVNQDFIDAVTPFIGNSKLYGFYLVDEPDPTGQWGPQASAADLQAESDWIHDHMPNAKTFIMLMNEGSAEQPHFSNTYAPENTHVDLFGIDWYPIWTDRTLAFTAIDKYVAAAQNIGISLDQIVPTYQTFGGGDWLTESGSHHQLPTTSQEQELLDHWASLVPNPAFDYAYSWGSQNGDTALESSAELQQVFLQHNTQQSIQTGSSVQSAAPASILVPDTSQNALPVPDTGATPMDGSGVSAPVTHAGSNAAPATQTNQNAIDSADSSGDRASAWWSHDTSKSLTSDGFGFGTDQQSSSGSTGAADSAWNGNHDAFHWSGPAVAAGTTADTASPTVAGADLSTDPHLTNHHTDYHLLL